MIRDSVLLRLGVFGWYDMEDSTGSQDGLRVNNSNGINGVESRNSLPWTFFTNHAHVLIVLSSEPDLVLREVAIRVGITERAVQRIVQELEGEGYLERERMGRRNHYKITRGKHLRHPVESHCTIDEILELIAKNQSESPIDE